jgi:hypothetical protein
MLDLKGLFLACVDLKYFYRSEKVLELIIENLREVVVG